MLPSLQVPFIQLSGGQQERLQRGRAIRTGCLVISFVVSVLHAGIDGQRKADRATSWIGDSRSGAEAVNRVLILLNFFL